MKIPEFNYLYGYGSEKWLAYNWVPDRFVWDVFFDKTKDTVEESLIISVRFEEFTRAAIQSGRPTMEAEQLATDAMRFLLATPQYASFLKGCECLIWTTNPNIDNSNNLNYIEASLTGIGNRLRENTTAINELDVIGHFFGISPIPDEKLFSLL